MLQSMSPLVAPNGHAADVAGCPLLGVKRTSAGWDGSSGIGHHLALTMVTPPGYLILAKHSFRRSSSERTCVSMASCNAAVPLLDNSAEAFLSRFCLQSRIACLVALWASDVALRYAFMQASAIEHVWHSSAAAALETSKVSVAAKTFIAFPRYWP